MSEAQSRESGNWFRISSEIMFQVALVGKQFHFANVFYCCLNSVIETDRLLEITEYYCSSHKHRFKESAQTWVFNRLEHIKDPRGVQTAF